jgi:hypothetical protein
MPFHEHTITAPQPPAPLPPTATVAAYCAAYRAAIIQHAATDWTYAWATNNAAQLDRFIDGVRQSLLAKKATFGHTAPCSVAAWKAIGFTGKPTWKVLHALPPGDDPAPVTQPAPKPADPMDAPIGQRPRPIPGPGHVLDTPGLVDKAKAMLAGPKGLPQAPPRPAWMSTHVVDPSWVEKTNTNRKLVRAVDPTPDDPFEMIADAVTKHLKEALDPKDVLHSDYDTAIGRDATHETATALNRLLVRILDHVNDALMKHHADQNVTPDGFVKDGDYGILADVDDPVLSKGFAKPLTQFLQEITEITSGAAATALDSDDVDHGKILAWAWENIRDGSLHSTVAPEEMLFCAFDCMDEREIEAALQQFPAFAHVKGDYTQPRHWAGT